MMNKCLRCITVIHAKRIMSVRSDDCLAIICQQEQVPTLVPLKVRKEHWPQPDLYRELVLRPKETCWQIRGQGSKHQRRTIHFLTCHSTSVFSTGSGPACNNSAPTFDCVFISALILHEAQRGWRLSGSRDNHVTVTSTAVMKQTLFVPHHSINLSAGILRWKHTHIKFHPHCLSFCNMWCW